MALSGPIELVLRLGIAPRIGAIVLGEQAVDTHFNGGACPIAEPRGGAGNNRPLPRVPARRAA